jgi:cell division protein FtsN
MKNSKGMIILLVALAALTLVVVIGLFFFYPKEQPKPAVTPASTTPSATPATPGTPLPDAFDPVEWTRDPKATALQTPAPAANGTAGANEQGFTVTLPAEPAPAVTQALPASPGATFPAETKAAPAATAPAATTKPAPVKAAPVAKAVKTVKVTEFWIQVGSFKDRYQAENTAKALETQGLKGTLTTASVNGLNVVRVRVGPYANEAEAGKFLAWLKPVKEFTGSYITKASATRTN